MYESAYCRLVFFKNECGRYALMLVCLSLNWFVCSIFVFGRNTKQPPVEFQIEFELLSNRNHLWQQAERWT